MSKRSPSDAFVESLRRWSKKSLGDGAAFARLSSASAKPASSEIALSKCWIESCACSFSASSRPCRNSFFAASEAVVTGILPLSGEAGMGAASGLVGASLYDDRIMLQLRSTSVADTHAIAAALAGMARAGDLIVLAGEMGSGKTAFAQGFAAALGVTEPITSPTYTLVHSYPIGRITLHHADIYRLTTLHEVADLALNELLEADGIVLVEWGDVVAASLGDELAQAVRAVEVDAWA
jgi:tRNA threonylcarbamoyl adenosine modification protein YjeE